MAKKEYAELTIYSAYSILSDVGEISPKFRESLERQAEEIAAQGKAIAEKADVFAITVVESGYSPADNIVRYAVGRILFFNLRLSFFKTAPSAFCRINCRIQINAHDCPVDRILLTGR